MRRITENAINAFNSNRNFTRDNTTVKSDGHHTELLLHGHCIAWKYGHNIYINDCGWQTNTTKDRLNAIPGVSIYQKDFIWYLTTPNHNDVEMQPGETYKVV